jgi:hypothetical protein
MDEIRLRAGARTLQITAVWGALLIMAGCGGTSGPDLANVHGTVTLDGKPLSGAIVAFSPVVEGNNPARPVQAVTDAAGKYIMQYSSSRSGALPGKYRVAISTFRAPAEDDDGNKTAGTPETIPDVYNAKSDLTADVTMDGKPIDFALKSDAGQVVQRQIEPEE